MLRTNENYSNLDTVSINVISHHKKFNKNKIEYLVFTLRYIVTFYKTFQTCLNINYVTCLHCRNIIIFYSAILFVYITKT